MRTVFERSLPVAVLLSFSLPVAGHHSRAMYDDERVLTIEGVVTRYEWTNPHVYLYVEAPVDGGDAVVWELESNVTTIMRRHGWSRDTFAPGDRVTVRANPARDSRRNLALVSSVERDGVTFAGRAADLDAGGAQARADSLSGIWEVPPTPHIRRFSDPSSWALTRAGAEAVAAYDDRTMNPQLQCTPRTAPWLMIFTGVHKIDVGDSSVAISTEYDTVERIVHMDLTTHDGAPVTHQGHSIGWWEGDALVVETTHFSGHRSGSARGVPSGPRKRVLERFALNPDRRSLTYRFELEDPEYLAEPVTGELQSAYRPDLDFVPVACDPEVARRFAGD